MLGNSTKGLIPLQKQCLYRYCALPITLYGFQLWYYNKASLYYSLNILKKMQCKAAIWITGAFHTSPMDGIEAIATLIPIYLHLKNCMTDSFLDSFLSFQIISSSHLSPMIIPNSFCIIGLYWLNSLQSSHYALRALSLTWTIGVTNSSLLSLCYIRKFPQKIIFMTFFQIMSLFTQNPKMSKFRFENLIMLSSLSHQIPHCALLS